MFGVTVDYLIGENTNKTSSINNLEEEFPEGVKLLRRALKELTPNQRAKMVKLIELCIELFSNEEEL